MRRPSKNSVRPAAGIWHDSRNMVRYQEYGTTAGIRTETGRPGTRNTNGGGETQSGMRGSARSGMRKVGPSRASAPPLIRTAKRYDPVSHWKDAGGAARLRPSAALLIKRSGDVRRDQA